MKDPEFINCYISRGSISHPVEKKKKIVSFVYTVFAKRDLRKLQSVLVTSCTL